MTNKLKIDTLALKLRTIDEANYDHSDMSAVFHYLSELEPRLQRMVIKVALGVDYDLQQLMEHVRSQFVILKQNDDDGKYCGLGFGAECTSVATWDHWGLPKKAQDVNITKVCYDDGQGNLRCGHLLDFAELWMEMNDASFEQFLKGIRTDVGEY